MRDAKKSSEWVQFEERQRREYREAHPRSWLWAKVVGVLVVGIGFGVLAVYFFGAAKR